VLEERAKELGGNFNPSYFFVLFCLIYLLREDVIISFYHVYILSLNAGML
jgi:hypothetical protein